MGVKQRLVCSQDDSKRFSTTVSKSSHVFASTREEGNGGRGIRTPGTVPRTAVFKTAGFNRSPIPPILRILPKTVEIPGIGS